MATYDLTTTSPTKLVAGDILNCPYSGAAKSITLPAGQYKLEVWGAQGGYRSSTSYGGKGGYSVGTVTITAPTVIYIYSGGSGRTGGTAGGFNGGGLRASYYGGGGGSDIRIGSDSLYARVIVAGGGGSDGASNKAGGYGGGTSGQSRTDSYGSGGYGGTQTGNTWLTTNQTTNTSGSSSYCYAGFWFGGNGCYYKSGYGGSGGGGWYGGSGAYPDSSGDDDRGGGGGSGYIYTSGTASNYPSGCLLNSGLYLTNASTIDGSTTITDPDGTPSVGRAGDGYCRITVVSVVATLAAYIKLNDTYVSADTIYVKDNGVWKEQDKTYVKVNGVWKPSE